MLRMKSCETLYLRCLEGRTAGAIAAVLALTPTQVRVRAHRLPHRPRPQHPWRSRRTGRSDSMAHNHCLRLGAGALAAALFLPLATARADFLQDPVGDTFGKGAVQHDITSYIALSDPSKTQTIFIVNFNDTILPASSFAARSLVGYIDIDTDRNAATGGNKPWGQQLTGGNN